MSHIRAEDLEVGDEIRYCNEWRTVLSVYVHPNSCYQKCCLSQSDSSIPLSIKLSRRLEVEVKGAEEKLLKYSRFASGGVDHIISKLKDLESLSVKAGTTVNVVGIDFSANTLIDVLKSELRKAHKNLDKHIVQLTKE